MITKRRQSTKMQFFAASVVNLLMIGYGLKAGWAIPNINLLRSKETPLPSGPITMEEASWITSLMPLGSMFGNVFYGFVTKRFGRKKPLMSVSFPMMIGWILILFAQNPIYLYVARFLHGFCIGGILLMIPVFLIEIANDHVRGILGSSVQLTGQLGIVFVIVFGTCFGFIVPPIFMMSVIIVFAVSFYFFPETPVFLAKHNDFSAAEKSLQFYRGIGEKDYDLLQLEMSKIKNAIGTDMEIDKRSMKLTDFTTRPGSKAMTIGIVLAFLTQASGCFALLNYAAHFFELSGSNLSTNLSTITIGVIQFCGAIVMIFLVDRAGRRILYMISTAGATFGYIVLGVYFLLESWQYDVEAFKWIPVVSLSFVLFVGSIAILNLPFTVIGEIIPQQIKEFGVTSCFWIISLCAFLALKFLPDIIDTLGLCGCMFLFAGVCSSCGLFIVLFMPETKGASYAEIMKSLQ